MYTLAIRRKVTYFILAASVVFLLAAPTFSAPVFAGDCEGTSTTCGGG